MPFLRELIVLCVFLCVFLHVCAVVCIITSLRTNVVVNIYVLYLIGGNCRDNYKYIEFLDVILEYMISYDCIK